MVIAFTNAWTGLTIVTVVVDVEVANDVGIEIVVACTGVTGDVAIIRRGCDDASEFGDGGGANCTSTIWGIDSGLPGITIGVVLPESVVDGCVVMAKVDVLDDVLRKGKIDSYLAGLPEGSPKNKLSCVNVAYSGS